MRIPWDELKRIVNVTCKQHPRYKFKRAPTSKCKVCWKIWYTYGQPRRQLGPQ